MLFGVTDPAKKDARGAYAADVDAPVNRVLAAVRDRGVEALMIAAMEQRISYTQGHRIPMSRVLLMAMPVPKTSFLPFLRVSN